METENIFLIHRILVAIFWLNLHQERQLQMKWKARENINIFLVQHFKRENKIINQLMSRQVPLEEGTFFFLKKWKFVLKRHFRNEER